VPDPFFGCLVEGLLCTCSDQGRKAEMKSIDGDCQKKSDFTVNFSCFRNQDQNNLLVRPGDWSDAVRVPALDGNRTTRPRACGVYKKGSIDYRRFPNLFVHGIAMSCSYVHVGTAPLATGCSHLQFTKMEHAWNLTIIVHHTSPSRRRVRPGSFPPQLSRHNAGSFSNPPAVRPPSPPPPAGI
jgi:hypothetical protein